MIVRELLTRLGFSVDDKKITVYENRVRGMADNFRNLLVGVAGVAAVAAIGRVADQMQSLQARVGMLPQTVDEAGVAFDAVGARASAARQSIDAYANLYIKLSNAGKDYITTQEQGLRITDTLSKALVVGGANAQEQSSAMLQFAQAIGSGVLQGDELRAMAEAAPQFMDELAKAIGIPRSELKKMGSDGKLTSRIVVEAVEKMGSVFEEKFKQMPMTIGQATTIMGNRWSMFINKINQKSGAVTAVSEFLLEGFDWLEGKLDDMVDFFGGATNTIKFFGIALAAALAPLVGGVLVGALAFLLSPLGLVMAALVLLGLAIEDVYQWMNGGDSVIGKFLGPWEDARLALSAWVDRVTSKFQAFKDYISNLVDLDKVVGMLDSLAAGVQSMIEGVINMILGNFQMLLGLLTLDSEVFFAGLNRFFGGFGDLVSGAMETVKHVINLALEVIFAQFKAVFTEIKDWIFSSLKEGISSGLKYLPGLQLATDLGSKIGTLAGAASSPSGVPLAGAGATSNITVNQTLPPGTPAEVAGMAKTATVQAIDGSKGRLARGLGVAS